AALAQLGAHGGAEEAGAAGDDHRAVAPAVARPGAGTARPGQVGRAGRGCGGRGIARRVDHGTPWYRVRSRTPGALRVADRGGWDDAWPACEDAPSCVRLSSSSNAGTGCRVAPRARRSSRSPRWPAPRGGRTPRTG